MNDQLKLEQQFDLTIKHKLSKSQLKLQQLLAANRIQPNNDWTIDTKENPLTQTTSATLKNKRSSQLLFIQGVFPNSYEDIVLAKQLLHAKKIKHAFINLPPIEALQ
jgi:hypothetical protein